MPSLVDSHCHLNFPDLAVRTPEILANMQEAGVGHAMCISVTLERFPEVLALAERHDNLFATVGVHPDYEVGVVDAFFQLAGDLFEIGQQRLIFARLGVGFGRLDQVERCGRAECASSVVAANPARTWSSASAPGHSPWPDAGMR